MIDTRLRRALRALLPEFFPTVPFSCPRKYRVVRMRPSVSSATLTRAELQIVNAASGMPTMLMVSIAPGLAGARSELTPGSFVLVQFIDGDDGQPIVTHYSTADDPAWKPVNTTIDATGTIKIGPSATAVELASGSDTVLIGAETGRVVRYGDVIMFPVSVGAVPTGIAVTGAKLGDTPAPVGPVIASKVKA